MARIPRFCVFLLLEESYTAKNGQKFDEFFGISYSTDRDVFKKKHVSPFVKDFSIYGTHVGLSCSYGRFDCTKRFL